MPKYIIERELPGASNLSEEELRGIAQTSCSVLEGDVGAGYHWVQSFVAGDKIYCIHVAPNEEAVREHARQGGFPANTISEIKATIDPTTAEALPAH
ncbi:MAG TPA: DUF4242 domain-containing protein [Longimicrobiaceae bacterium]